jgi:hypothetical protein
MTKARVNADNASADIQGVTAGTGLTGGGTSGAVTVSLDTSSVYVVPSQSGNSGKYLTTNGSATSWGAVSGAPDFLAGKNKLINGAFQVWQRSTSVTTDSWTADRFYWAKPGTGVGSLTQQTFTPGAAPVAGYEGQFFARSAITSVGSSSYIQFQNVIEDVRTLAGQTVTLSFWARLNSGSVGGTYARFIQSFGSGGSTNITTDAMAFTTTGSWQRFSLTQTLPSISGKTITSNSALIVDVVVPFSANHTIDFWGFQVEAGSVATPFTTATGSIQGELAACQRYYYNHASGINQSVGAGGYTTSAEVSGAVYFPVEMRAKPTLVVTSGTDYYRAYRAGTNDDFNVFGLYSETTSKLAFLFADSLVSGTAGHFAILTTNNASSSIAFSAEL